MAGNHSESTYPSAFLVVRPGKAARCLDVFGVIARRFVLVAIYLSISWVLWWLHRAGLLVVEYNFPHSSQGDEYLFALIEHLIDLFEPGYRLRGHANPLVFVCPLPVDLGKVCYATGALGHLSQLAQMLANEHSTLYFVERRLHFKPIQMPFDGFAIRSHAGAIHFLLFWTTFMPTRGSSERTRRCRIRCCRWRIRGSRRTGRGCGQRVVCGVLRIPIARIHRSG